MHPDEIVLFLAVIALALALVIVVVAPRIRQGRRSTVSSATTAPEAVARTPVMTPGTAVAHAAAMAPPPPPPTVAMVCPTCRRQYAGGLKFCPYDARVLARDVHPGLPEPETAAGGNPGKICPTCARRYDAVAVVCGRDGCALVSVN